MKHYMELTNGVCIEAFPKVEQPEKIGLDATEQQLLDQKRFALFLQYTHRLIAESDRILADSRMFLAPVPIRNGLAYTGTAGLRNPTLGVYIEWWRNHKCAWAEDKRGALRPLYYIAGSPFSGRNSCNCVDAAGKHTLVSVNQFSSVWSSFAKINSRYTETKRLYDAYTLEEVIERLFGE